MIVVDLVKTNLQNEYFYIIQSLSFYKQKIKLDAQPLGKFKLKINSFFQAPINEETELDSMKNEEKEQSPPDKTKSDKIQPFSMNIKKRMEEKRENKKDARLEVKEDDLDLERTPSGRVRRHSAQVAVFHLQEIAEDELAKDWGTKRRIKDDLVPDIKRVRKTIHK